MKKHIFILGREPQLSLAEINNRLAADGVAVNWLSVDRWSAYLAADLPDNFFDNLAGSIKQADYLVSLPNEPKAIGNFLQEFMLAAAKDSYIFGFSWYGRRSPDWLRNLGLNIKKYFKNQGQRSRLVVGRDSDLSSVIVEKNKLLPPKGFDFIFLPQVDGRVMIGQTVKVQDFAAWSNRDYGRPARQAKVGMLPPKLARLMVNLALTNQPIKQSILDPFCGSGTVLQEAAVIGCQDLWGSDLDARGVDRTGTNLKWLKQAVPGKSFVWNLQAVDVRQLDSFIKQKKFDVIVTEPYLGPPLNGQESAADLKIIQKELGDFYRAFLKNLHQALKQDGRLVMVWPALRFKNEGYLFLDLLKQLKQIGFRAVNLLPKLAPADWLTNRGSYLYQRPDQKVIREIWVLEKS